MLISLQASAFASSPSCHPKEMRNINSGSCQAYFRHRLNPLPSLCLRPTRPSRPANRAVVPIDEGIAGEADGDLWIGYQLAVVKVTEMCMCMVCDA